ncbi:MAG TPA: CorA family divalent cation transporter, partial [Trichococcus flocculiformis]|nr:CorA family divalent cation transporter [Trichococcus flocculiformis]
INKNHPLITKSIQSASLGDDLQSQELLRDIIDISSQAEVMVTESSKMIDQLSEVFSSVIANNLNNIMKVLTSITIVLTIPTIIAGFWGMNVDLPFENHPWAFGITSLLTIFICFLTVYWLKKKDYF